MKLDNKTCTRQCPIRKRMHDKEYLLLISKNVKGIMDAVQDTQGKPDRHKNSCRLQTRVDQKTDVLFRALCLAKHRTVSDMLLELVKNAVAQAEGEA